MLRTVRLTPRTPPPPQSMPATMNLAPLPFSGHNLSIRGREGMHMARTISGVMGDVPSPLGRPMTSLSNLTSE